MQGQYCEHLTLASVEIFFFREALEGEEVIIDVALVGISNSFSFSGLITVTSSSARELGRSLRGFCVQKVILGALFLF